MGSIVSKFIRKVGSIKMDHIQQKEWDKWAVKEHISDGKEHISDSNLMSFVI